MDILVDFFGHLNCKEKTGSQDNLTKIVKLQNSHDENLLQKILQDHDKTKPDKYLNLTTGRFILATSASKKRYVNRDYYFCGDDHDQFERIDKKIRHATKDHSGQTKPRPKGSSQKVLGYKPRPRVKSTMVGPKLAHGNTPKRRTVPKITRHFLWMRDYGNIAEAKCQCCGVTLITEATSEAGHVIAFAKGGSTRVENLKLICRTCNADMGTQNLHEFMQKNNFPLKVKS